MQIETKEGFITNKNKKRRTQMQKKKKIKNQEPGSNHPYKEH